MPAIRPANLRLSPRPSPPIVSCSVVRKSPARGVEEEDDEGKEDEEEHES